MFYFFLFFSPHPFEDFPSLTYDPTGGGQVPRFAARSQIAATSLVSPPPALSAVRILMTLETGKVLKVTFIFSRMGGSEGLKGERSEASEEGRSSVLLIPDHS